MKLREIMTQDIISLLPHITVREAADIFLQYRIDGAPVIDEKENIIGIFTKSHIMRYVRDDYPITTLVEELMTRDITFAHPEDDIEDLLQHSEVGRLVIAENDKMIGLCTRTDLVKAFFNSYKDIVSEMETIINSTHNLIVSVDKEGRINIFNRAAEQVLGMRAEEVKGKKIIDVVPTSKLLHTVSTGQAEPLQKIEIGSRCFISNRSPIKKEDKIIGAVAVLQDISEMESISLELETVKSLNRELDVIIDSSFDGLYVTDGGGVTIRVNKAFERMSGLKAEAIIGREINSLVPDKIFSPSVTAEVIKKQKPATILQETMTGRTTLSTASPVFDEEGNLFRIVANVRDITELKELERKLEKTEELKKRYENQLKAYNPENNHYSRVVASSYKMRDLISLTTKLGEVDSTVLITGESGVGKELIAEMIHSNSNRKEGPFIKVNCGAIPENLLESELFGYEPGSFTGAAKEGKSGLFELAHKGVVFLDEIGEMPFNLQVKLLRALQTREIIRVGASKSKHINMRVIAASNRDLVKMVQEKTFREDLFYRLNVIPVHVPPLRDRKEDIPPLIQHFTDIFNRKYNKNKYIVTEIIEVLQNYSWPGNVRELENFIERLLVITPGNRITIRDIPASYIEAGSSVGSKVNITGLLTLKDAVETVEKQLIEQAVMQYKTTRKIAKVLQVNASTISRKAAKYNININTH